MIQRAILSMIAFAAIAVSIATCALMREVTLRLLALVSVLLVVSASTRAEDVSEGAYFCTTIAAGGVAYNATLKKWEGTVFRPDEKFVMRVAFVKHTKEKVGLIDMDVDYYKATVTQEGSNKAQPCTATYGNRGKDEIPVSRYARIITCSAALKEYAFDLETNRFMVDYLVGYLGGKDDNSDTPAISIGTCTKIPQ